MLRYVYLLPISRNIHRKLSVEVSSAVKNHMNRNQGWEENAFLILPFLALSMFTMCMNQLCKNLKNKTTETLTHTQKQLYIVSLFV